MTIYVKHLSATVVTAKYTKTGSSQKYNSYLNLKRGVGVGITNKSKERS